MANWYYRNRNNEKVGPITTTALKALAAQGLITPETVIENTNGRSAVAGKVNGLTFPTPSTPVETEIVSIDDIEPASVSPPAVEQTETIAMQFGNVPVHTVSAPIESEVYGLSAPEPKTTPPAELNPFTGALPVSEPAPALEPPVLPIANDPSDEANPFVTEISIESNPFVGKMPKANDPVDESSTSDSPFTAPMPEVNRFQSTNTASHAKPMSRTGGNRRGFILYVIAFLGLTLFIWFINGGYSSRSLIMYAGATFLLIFSIIRDQRIANIVKISVCIAIVFVASITTFGSAIFTPMTYLPFFNSKPYVVKSMGRMSEDDLVNNFVGFVVWQTLMEKPLSDSFLEQYKDIPSVSKSKYKHTIGLYEFLRYNKSASQREFEKAVSLAVVECQRNGLVGYSNAVTGVDDFDLWNKGMRRYGR